MAGLQPEHQNYPNHWRLVRQGVATITEIETIMSLDDVDLWNLYLDSVDEATSRPDSKSGGDE